MNGSYVLTAAGRIEMEDRKINILGITYTVKEVVEIIRNQEELI